MSTPQPTRPRFTSKVEWARGRAAELRATADKLTYESSNGSSLKANRKYQQIARLRAEAARFDAIASALARRPNGGA